MANAWGSAWGDSVGGPSTGGGGLGFINESLARALRVVADGKDELLQYASAPGGAFTALVGFVIHQDLLTEPNYDDGNRAPTQTRRAFLKGPMLPALYLGYQVRDNSQVPPMIWAVEGSMFESQQIVTLSRQERVLGSGPDRGASA